jgi:hypothetical protein
MTSKAQQLQDRIKRGTDYGLDPNEARRALAYYLGRPLGNEVAGQPALQSTDVADMVHAVQAQLLPSFTSDSVCEIEPDGPEDDAQARLESAAVNRAIMEDGRGYVVIGAAIKNALLLKAAIVRAWVEEYTLTAKRTYQGGPDAAAMLAAESDEGESVEREEDGTITVTMQSSKRRLRLAPVDPLNFVVDADHDSVLLEDCRFCAERWPTTKGELVEMGFPARVVRKLPTEDGNLADGLGVRNRQGQPPATLSTGDWASERVYCWHCYERQPDGTLTYYLLSGQEILDEAPATVMPYATGAALIEPHQFWGLSLFDRLKSVQDGKTLAIRQWVANLAAMNIPKTACNDNVNRDDLLNGRAGGVVRVDGAGPVAESILPLPATDSGPSSLTFLQYMDQVRADRGGAALQMASGEAQLAGGQIGSMGVDRIFSVQEQMAGMIARNLAETLLRSLFLLVHRLLAEEYGESLMLRYADQWVPVDPASFKPRSQVNVKQGLSPGERSRRVAHLQAVVAAQSQMLQAGLGGILVDVPGLHRGLLDLGRAMELDSVAQYWVDPAGQASQQASQAQQQQQQQMAQMQQQLAMLDVQVKQAGVENDRMRLQLDAMIHRDEMAQQYREMVLNAEIKEAELTGAITSDLIAAQSAARSAADAADGGTADPAGG